jgi:hypothetical protein
MGYTFEKQTSDEERPMNCPHCTSPFAKEQRKKTILGYREKRGADHGNGQSTLCFLVAAVLVHRLLLPVPARERSSLDQPR